MLQPQPEEELILQYMSKADYEAIDLFDRIHLEGTLRICLRTYPKRNCELIQYMLFLNSIENGKKITIGKLHFSDRFFGVNLSPGPEESFSHIHENRNKNKIMRTG
jgi:hypothetical protein